MADRVLGTIAKGREVVVTGRLGIEAMKAKLAEAEAVAHAAETERAGYKATAEQLQKVVEMQKKEIERLRLEGGAAAELRGKAATLQEQNDKLMERLSKPDKKG